LVYYDKFEDTKRVIGSHNSKKDRQYNAQKKRERRKYNGQEKKEGLKIQCPREKGRTENTMSKRKRKD
jgi:hypothetical protein